MQAAARIAHHGLTGYAHGGRVMAQPREGELAGDAGGSGQGQDAILVSIGLQALS